MNILQVHSRDLIGGIYNGYELQRELNANNIVTKQLVKRKSSKDDNVREFSLPYRVDERIQILENELSINNLLPSYGKELVNREEFQEADIIHYHMIHNYLISLYDMPKLTKKKPSVWTVHDPWIITGHCVQPLGCNKWKTGCVDCPQLDTFYFPMTQDNAAMMWRIKESVYQQLDIDLVVATDFMKNILQESPLTTKFTRVHKIPFGIDMSLYENCNRETLCSERLSKEFVIGFRVDNDPIKGVQFIWDMLRKREGNNQWILYCIGSGSVPKDIKEKYQVIEYGLENKREKIAEFYSLCDVFLMPSLAESFGMMAIEAMASQCTVVCFKDTVLEEVTNAPECGVAVKYADAKHLLERIEKLSRNRDECFIRGLKSKEWVKKTYQMKDYVSKHIELYNRIICRSSNPENEYYKMQ